MSSSDSQQQSQPSMLAGHAKFAQGAISSALGYETGQATKEAGIKEMREAKSDQPPQVKSGILGSAENLAGRAVGCEGMEDEGTARKAE